VTGLKLVVKDTDKVPYL